MRQMANLKYDDVILYARARDAFNYGPEVTFGPFTIDNSFIEGQGGGIGSDSFTYPIRGFLTFRHHLDIPKITEPVQGNLSSAARTCFVMEPVVGGPYAWQQALTI